MTNIATMLAAVTQASNPVSVIRALVLEQGGAWADPENLSGLFEIQLAGLVAIGPTARAAVEDWNLQAQDIKSVPPDAAA